MHICWNIISHQILSVLRPRVAGNPPLPPTCRRRVVSVPKILFHNQMTTVTNRIHKIISCWRVRPVPRASSKMSYRCHRHRHHSNYIYILYKYAAYPISTGKPHIRVGLPVAFRRCLCLYYFRFGVCCVCPLSVYEQPKSYSCFMVYFVLYIFFIVVAAW